MLLLDTHSWIWSIEGDTRRVGKKTQALLARAEARERIRVSPVSIFEIVALHTAMLTDPAITRVEDLCALAGCSKRTLQRLFREYVGVTPKWVLQRVRLHEAADRMADGEHDWPRLALELGYFDQAHFIKAFKAAIGLSPGDYGLKTSTM